MINVAIMIRANYMGLMKDKCAAPDRLTAHQQTAAGIRAKSEAMSEMSAHSGQIFRAEYHLSGRTS